jgi:hypothetical protein
VSLLFLCLQVQREGARDGRTPELQGAPFVARGGWCKLQLLHIFSPRTRRIRSECKKATLRVSEWCSDDSFECHCEPACRRASLPQSQLAAEPACRRSSLPQSSQSARWLMSRVATATAPAARCMPDDRAGFTRSPKRRYRVVIDYVGDARPPPPPRQGRMLVVSWIMARPCANLGGHRVVCGFWWLLRVIDH